MKIKCRVALISQTPRQGENGETVFTTNVKLSPLNILSGDIQLSFAKADVVFHPVHELRDPKEPRNKVKTMIHENSLIQEATCYVEGQPAIKFQAGYPDHPGHTDLGINPVVSREAPIVEINFTPVA